ncbi:hypothetical protein DL96DRAFT_109007 [Flagelloscypha sp. PMI_526]|nr:hypothetical protein DL96DRAFT_109007 [Flagelloscypha sp. PMI_526]
MPSQGLTQLPADILIEIFLGISAFSRLSLRQTCKILYNLSKERTLWILCLKKIITECGLFCPSFQYSKMTNEQMESAANMQLRLRCNLAQGRTSAENVPVSPLLPLDILSTQFSLVPGGRFLVSFYDSLLQLWDLGIVGCGSLEPLVMAATTCTLPPRKKPSVDVNFEPDSDELFVTVSGLWREDGFPTTWRTIYRICPVDPSPKFIIVGQLDSKLFEATSVSFFDTSRLIVAFAYGRTIWLWYVCQNTLVWWDEGTRIYKMWTSENGHLVVIPGPTWQGGSIDRVSILELPQPLDSSIGSPHCVKIERPLIRTISWKRPHQGDNDPKYRFIDSLASPHMTSIPTFDSLAYFRDMRDGELFRAFAIVRYSLIPSEESSIGLSLNIVHETIFEGAMKILFIQGLRHREVVTHMDDIRLYITNAVLTTLLFTSHPFHQILAPTLNSTNNCAQFLS